MTKEQLRLTEAIRRYFESCDATRERHTLKNGGFFERQIPYTLFGLAHATGYTPKAILSLCNSNGRGWKVRLMKRAVYKVAAYTQERALLGELTHQVALQALSELNDPNGSDVGGLTVVMDDSAERYAR